MRGSKAKKIRKIVYGDHAHGERKYVISNKGQIMNKPGSLRAKYLKAKELVRMGVRV